MSVIQLVRNLFSPGSSLRLKDCFGDDVAAAILEKQDLDALKRLFASIPANWTDRYFYSLAMSRSFPLELLAQWTESESTSADARLVYGARLVKWAREARGYGLGSTVSEKRAEEFYRRLEMARKVLEECWRLRPEDPTPWVLLIMVAVYLQMGEEAEREFFDEAVARDPDNWHAFVNRLTGLSRKYGGSHELMYAFARHSAVQARPGSLVPLLLTKAHSEYWKYLHLFQDKYAEAAQFLNEQLPRDETVAAYQRTLGSHRYEKRVALFARLNATGWFWLIKNREILGRELRELNGCIHDIHWRWVGTEGDLAKARKLASVD